MFNLEEAVRTEAADLIASYRFGVHALAPNDTLLLADRYALRFRLDRDGVSLTYVDTSGDVPLGYDVFGFLWRKRRKMLHFADRAPDDHDAWRANVEALVRHLGTAGEDIAAGHTGWLTEYELPPFPMPELARAVSKSAS